MRTLHLLTRDWLVQWMLKEILLETSQSHLKVCVPHSIEEQVWKYEIIWWPSLQRYGTSLPYHRCHILYDTNIDRMWAKKWREREYSSHDLNPWIQIPSYWVSKFLWLFKPGRLDFYVLQPEESWLMYLTHEKLRGGY